MKHQKIPQNFIYPNITPRHYRFGSGEAIDNLLREDGDWRDFLPPEEYQNIRGIESSACYVEGSQHGIACILEEQFKIADKNFSARFNALLSNGTPYGGDPLSGGDSIRNDGLIEQALMDFTTDIMSWNDFHSWKGVNEAYCREVGKEFVGQWKLNYDIVFTRDESVENKYKKLREALKRSPVPMSVLAWYQNDKGEYYKPEGSSDNHLVLCVYLDENNCAYIWDTYSPFLKKLSPFYNSDFAMRWSVEKKEVIEGSPSTDIASVIMMWIKRLWSLFTKYTFKPA